MEKLRPTREIGRKFKFSAIAAAALTLAACNANLNPTQEISDYSRNLLGELNGTHALNGDKFLRIAIVEADNPKDQAELDANKGANVRSYPDIEGMVVGKISEGIVIQNSILTDGDGGKWLAKDCTSLPMIEINSALLPKDPNTKYPILPPVCFVFARFIQSTDK